MTVNLAMVILVNFFDSIFGASRGGLLVRRMILRRSASSVASIYHYKDPLFFFEEALSMVVSDKYH